MILGWTGDNGDPDNFLDAMLGCDAVGGNNWAQWCNKEFDDLVTKAKETADQAERTKLYEEAQVVSEREAPWDTLDHSLGRRADAQERRGFRPEPARRLRVRYRRHHRVMQDRGRRVNSAAVRGFDGLRSSRFPFAGGAFFDQKKLTGK